ncbi:hypothetical protein P171DRAFT_161143 [Karstenula rhodostoma CBS 690.94]|uniref:Uncharacterized protein n=1 Tax=Karstenula rhodostoma CBS 690.94 TaxID=1392251 RepID=A0A9P4U5V0_9PLEO|nr:hypothetical protein P171DRAFT_161143 [Karstenula rhodostoma CBS 690.94]
MRHPHIRLLQGHRSLSGSPLSTLQHSCETNSRTEWFSALHGRAIQDLSYRPFAVRKRDRGALVIFSRALQLTSHLGTPSVFVTAFSMVFFFRRDFGLRLICCGIHGSVGSAKIISIARTNSGTYFSNFSLVSFQNSCTVVAS